MDIGNLVAEKKYGILLGVWFYVVNGLYGIHNYQGKKNGKNGFGLQIMEKYGAVFVYGMMFACFKWWVLVSTIFSSMS